MLDMSSAYESLRLGAHIRDTHGLISSRRYMLLAFPISLINTICHQSRSGGQGSQIQL